MKLSWSFLLSILYNAGQIAASGCAPDTFPSINASSFKIAAVREPPVNFALPIGINKTWVDLNLSATIDQALSIIEEAKAERVSLLAFPELYFPGYPVVSLHFKASESSRERVTDTLRRPSTPTTRLRTLHNMSLSLCQLIAITFADCLMLSERPKCTVLSGFQRLPTMPFSWRRC